MQELVAAYLPKLEALEAEYQSFEAEASLTILDSSLGDKAPKNSSWAACCCADARNGSFQIQRSATGTLSPSSNTEATSLGSRVLSFSPEGVFELRKSSNDGAFAIHRLGEKERIHLQVVAHSDYEPMFRCSHFAADSMRTLVTDSRSRIVAVKILQNSPQGRLVEVEFVLDKKWFGRARTWVRLSPDLGWRIVEWRSLTDDPETPGVKDRVEEHWVCTYAKSGDKLIPATVWQQVFHEQRGAETIRELVQERKAQITRFEFKDIPPEQFRLSKFGLPDGILKTADGSGRRWYASPWTVVCGLLVALVCGYACFRLVQRDSRPPG